MKQKSYTTVILCVFYSIFSAANLIQHAIVPK